MFLGTIGGLVVSDISLLVAMVLDLTFSELELGPIIRPNLTTITSHHRSNEAPKLKALTYIFSPWQRDILITID